MDVWWTLDNRRRIRSRPTRREGNTKQTETFTTRTLEASRLALVGQAKLVRRPGACLTNSHEKEKDSSTKFHVVVVRFLNYALLPVRA